MMLICLQSDSIHIPQNLRESFKYKTPLKKLSLNLPEYKHRGYEAVVHVNLSSKNGKDLGYAQSKTINIKNVRKFINMSKS